MKILLPVYKPKSYVNGCLYRIFELNQNDDLAKAIGACSECFGEDSECAECFGTGKPGNSIPDFILFNKYIQPAIQKYNKHYFNKN